MPRARPFSDVADVLRLKAEGQTDCRVSEITGVPVNTIRLWRNRGLSRTVMRALDPDEACEICGDQAHDLSALPQAAYSYLLAVYLGDGCLTA